MPGLPKDALGVPQDGHRRRGRRSRDRRGARRRPRFDADGRLLNGAEAIGEIVGRNVVDRFEGYYRNPEAEAERTRNGWYWSGDLGYRDDAGVFYFAGRAGEWLRVDSENFATAPVERILARFPGASGVAVYPVPDERTADDQVMAAIELDAGRRRSIPTRSVAFLAAQPDLGTKWAPRYVRVTTLPVGATNKIDKRPLRAERWYTDDPVYWRPGARARVPPPHRRRRRRARGPLPRVRSRRRDRTGPERGRGRRRTGSLPGIRILSVADLHYKLRQLDWVASVAADYDLVVLAGDLLDISSIVEPDAQIAVVLEYLRRLAARHDRRRVLGQPRPQRRERARRARRPRWLDAARDAGVFVDGTSFGTDRELVTVCPWWDGPRTRDDVDAQLAADAAVLDGRRWIWAYHAPPGRVADELDRQAPLRRRGPRRAGSSGTPPTSCCAGTCTSRRSRRRAAGSTASARPSWSTPAASPVPSRPASRSTPTPTSPPGCRTSASTSGRSPRR